MTETSGVVPCKQWTRKVHSCIKLTWFIKENYSQG